ncbi:hypothetical protein [Cellulosimicrobium sp. Marseille-Q8652]
MTPDATAARPAPGAPGRVAPRNPRTPATGRRRRAATLTALALVTSLLAAGCGVRLETPEPTEPSPDVHEVVRRTAVDDALAVADLVTRATPTVTDPAVLAALDDAGRFAEEHAQALGGVYDSGLADPAADDGDGSPDPVEVTTSPAAGDAGTATATAGTVTAGTAAPTVAETTHRAPAPGTRRPVGRAPPCRPRTTSSPLSSGRRSARARRPT